MVGNAPYNTTILTLTFHDLIPQPFPQFSHRRSFAVHQYPDFVYFSHDENHNKDCDNHGGDIEQNFPQWRCEHVDSHVYDNWREKGKVRKGNG